MTDWRIDDEMREHIRTLGIPNVPDCPNPPMALHRVGSFMDDEILKSRMKSIFGGRNTFLLNASGTGKTRILYEGLGFHWGFYFTSAVDTTRLGDRDLSSIINTGGLFGKKQFSFLPSEGDISVDLHDNLSLAHTYFSAVLLARLLIFKIFLDSAVAHGYKDEYKTIWLKVQLQLWSDDSVIPFRALINDLVDSFTQPEDFDAAISDTIEEIFSIQDISPVFVLLDEANSAVRRLQYSFRDDCGNSYPALKAVLNVWKHHLGHRPEFTFVVAGTEIPREYFVGEDWSDWTWSSDTGAFDDPERQREYIKAFLPSALYSSPAGQRLCDRIWKWARGRYILFFVSNDFLNNFIKAPRHGCVYIPVIGIWFQNTPYVPHCVRRLSDGRIPPTRL
ncbi:hypothetical protein L218DRAFT_865552 [Marasmius fiardii PR-910]|nr:hypothetical protein L218DRAFT_865552 [Marasmius fiardii PR-910]